MAPHSTVLDWTAPLKVESTDEIALCQGELLERGDDMHHAVFISLNKNEPTIGVFGFSWVQRGLVQVTRCHHQPLLQCSITLTMFPAVFSEVLQATRVYVCQLCTHQARTVGCFLNAFTDAFTHAWRHTLRIDVVIEWCPPPPLLRTHLFKIHKNVVSKGGYLL